MFEGIEAIKHNYSNQKTKTVKLWLSGGGSDGKAMQLHYRTLQPGALKCVQRTQVIDLNSILGFVYGAQSSTFLSRKTKIIGTMNFIKETRINKANL